MSKCYVWEMVNGVKSGNTPEETGKILKEGMDCYTGKIAQAISGHPAPDLPLVVASIRNVIAVMEKQMDKKEEFLARTIGIMLETEGCVIRMQREEEE